MSTGTGVNVSKANTYAITSAKTGLSVSKANVYAVVVSVPPGVNITKANVYAVATTGIYVNKVTGGAFMDSLGNPLANGYLLFELNQDETVASIDSGICSGITIKIPLDSSGYIVTNPAYYLWPNDVIAPSGSFYIVSAYTADGELVWGPNEQTITSTPSPFNVNIWVP